MIIRTAILWEMVKLVWNENSELSEKHPVFVSSVEVSRCISKALTVHLGLSYIIVYFFTE